MNKRSMIMVRRAGLAIAAGVMLATTSVSAMGAFQPPAREGAAGRPTPPPGAAARPEPREVLNRRLEDARRRAKMLEEAIGRLDAGEDPAQVMKDIEPPGGREGPEGRNRDTRGSELRGGERDGPRGERDGGRGREGGRAGPRDEPGREGPRGGRESGAMGPVEGDRDRLMELVRRHAPLHLRRIERLRESNPGAADRLLKLMAPRLLEAEEVQTRDPELYELRVEEVRTGIRVLDGVRDYREALKLAETDPTRAEKVAQAESEIRSRLDAAMTVRLNLQERDVVGLEQRLAKLREEVSKKQSGRAEAIEEAMKAIRERRQFRDAEALPADAGE